MKITVDHFSNISRAFDAIEDAYRDHHPNAQVDPDPPKAPGHG